MQVKICGLTSADAVAAAASAGAGYVGFVFFEKSPRNVNAEQAQHLAWEVPPGIVKVGLFVNPTDDALAEVLDIVPLDMIQLHGKETPSRVAEIKASHGLPVMKAIGVREDADFAAIETYKDVADQLLIDAKPPQGADLPGGNGLAFDWRLLQNRRFPLPWMLAGGLTPENAARAVNLTGATQLDVSSGVESAPGVKDSSKMNAFVAAVSGGATPRL
jgi:phosphoribosylanthranilate isomerase